MAIRLVFTTHEVYVRITFYALFILTALSSTAMAVEHWRLMGRHGGCWTLKQAAERDKVFSDISSPGDLADWLRRRGEQVTLREHPIPGGTSVFLDAPGVGLSLVFVPFSSCQKLGK